MLRPRKDRGRPKVPLYGGRETPTDVKQMDPQSQKNWRYNYNVANDPARVQQKEKTKEKKRTYMTEVRAGLRTVKPRATKGVTYTPGHTIIDCGTPQKKPRLTLRQQVDSLVRFGQMYTFTFVLQEHQCRSPV